ncbi:MAG: hypothetical protein EPO08_14745 [Rhodospirillaceae bacterium]|nr:MAG: hypothetical protein EPO08_14745 [Rhodospirillaceae bacterium]
MSTKTAKTKPAKSSFRYAPEDLAPRDEAREEASIEGFIKRNRDALNASINEARDSLKRGEGIAIRSESEFLAAIRGKASRSRSQKS